MKKYEIKPFKMSEEVKKMVDCSTATIEDVNNLAKMIVEEWHKWMDKAQYETIRKFLKLPYQKQLMVMDYILTLEKSIVIEGVEKR